MAGIGPGPFCGMILADLGAEVIRVDKHLLRALVHVKSQLVEAESIAVDLKSPQGVELF